MNQLTASMEKEVSQYRERLRKTGRAIERRRLGRCLVAIVKAHEKKYGPGLPGRDLSKAWAHSLSPEQEAWQAARELLVALAALVEELR